MTYLQLIMEQISPPRSITVTIWDNVTSHVTSISSNWSLPAYYAMVISPFILIFGDSILFFTVYLAKAHRRSLTRSIKRATKQPSQSRKASCRVNSHGQSLELSVCPSGPNRCIRVMCALGTGTVYRYIYIYRCFFSSLSFPALIFALPNINLWIMSPCIKNWLPSFSRQTRISMMNNGSAWKSRKTAKMLGVSLVAGCWSWKRRIKPQV